MQEKDYGNLPIEEFTDGLYRNVLVIKWTLLSILAVNLLDFIT